MTDKKYITLEQLYDEISDIKTPEEDGQDSVPQCDHEHTIETSGRPGITIDIQILCHNVPIAHSGNSYTSDKMYREAEIENVIKKCNWVEDSIEHHTADEHAHVLTKTSEFVQNKLERVDYPLLIVTIFNGHGGVEEGEDQLSSNQRDRIWNWWIVYAQCHGYLAKKPSNDNDIMVYSLTTKERKESISIQHPTEYVAKHMQLLEFLMKYEHHVKKRYDN